MNQIIQWALVMLWLGGLAIPTIWIQFSKEEKEGQRIGLSILYALSYLGISWVIIKLIP